MTRTTIDVGIDLGTTNSAIAVLDGVEPRIVKNDAEQSDVTPSAVRVDRQGRVSVGRAAKQRSEEDPDNTCVEFKLQMGIAVPPKVFAATGRSMAPEELSAEVLRSLRQDAAKHLGAEVEAAVITVPAAFELSACDATRAAAERAGLVQAPLLQEPTAAALAHGFQAADDDAFWLVYDFGGGTFDAAVVRIRDGELTVVDHRGDNNLGGKQVDWAVVEELLIPAVVREHPVSDLRRGNPARRRHVSKLKLAAEAAKIQLSRTASTEIVVELHDDADRPFEFFYDLTRAEVERLAEPFVVRTVNLCRKALADSGLGPGDIERALLVGGPTLAPYLRERLADPRAGLGVPLDWSQDPITVVARGAAVFAGAQRLDPALAGPPPPSGQYAVELEYRPMGPEIEPFVGGRVTGADTAGCSVEFVNDGTRPPWRSGRIPLSADGTFTTTLWAEKGRANAFRIELTDATGARRPVTPDTLTYTVGGVDTQPPLTHSIGVGLDGNKVERLFRKGTPLPARRRARLRTTVAVSRGGGGQGMIRIPVLEGEHARANRNRRVGRIEVRPDQVARDVPEGSAVELTVTVDESRTVVARAYVPMLDEEFDCVLDLRTEAPPDPAELAREVAAEKERLAEVRRKADELGDPRGGGVLARIDAERVVLTLDAEVDAASADPDAAAAAGRRLMDLRASVDEVEDEIEWPALVAEANELLPTVREVVQDAGEESHRSALRRAEEALQEAVAAHDADLLRQRTSELRRVLIQVLDYSGELPFLLFDRLCSMRPEMSDQREAAHLIGTGRRAADANDAAALRRVNSALLDLLPERTRLDPLSTVRLGR
ncbi:Hsp70 family protein [Actinomadura chibensis]|uniref:Hsp70 family protein n=1 Tax=Actinomadura chibensis TaxID=392828 RepID=A0A5D0NIL3_9ACTN|nr:Hsp70 family protein [Actinomadura chibensis]TYB44260.1 Hsp70 family protein [Actinomadura chibensis]